MGWDGDGDGMGWGWDGMGWGWDGIGWNLPQVKNFGCFTKFLI